MGRARVVPVGGGRLRVCPVRRLIAFRLCPVAGRSVPFSVLLFPSSGWEGDRPQAAAPPPLPSLSPTCFFRVSEVFLFSLDQVGKVVRTRLRPYWPVFSTTTGGRFAVNGSRAGPLRTAGLMGHTGRCARRGPGMTGRPSGCQVETRETCHPGQLRVARLSGRCQVTGPGDKMQAGRVCHSASAVVRLCAWRAS